MTDKFRIQYQEELDHLEGQALGAFDLVVRALDRTLEAIEHQDIQLAELVATDDDRIDGRYLEIHQGLITLLATQSPVATDLRLISALLHVIKNAERMGDQCVNICKLLPIVGHEPPVEDSMVRRILEMGAQVKIVEVAQTLIRMSGKPGIEIVYTGLRPGEKLSEELFSEADDGRETSNALVTAVDVPLIDPAVVTSTAVHNHEEAARWMAAAVDTEGAVAAS